MSQKFFKTKAGVSTPAVTFTNAANANLQVSYLESNTLSFSGTSGQLFSVTDSMSGIIFGVNDVSGVPSIEVLDTGIVRLAESFGNVLIGTSTDNGSKLQVTGNISVTGTVDGRDVSVDGTKLDGIEAGATADMTATEILNAIKTVDGVGSGLDADLLDGLVSATAATASTIVARDASGNFAANIITGNITGTAGNVTGVVAVANGGTGSSTQAGARTNLGLGTIATQNSVDYLNKTETYNAGHAPEGKNLANAVLLNDFANARLRGSVFTLTNLSLSNAQIDGLFDGKGTYLALTPSSLTFPVVIEFTLPRTLSYGASVGLSFGNTSWRTRGVKIESFTEGAWVTRLNTTTNALADIVVTMDGAAVGTTAVRYTFSDPVGTSSGSFRLLHLWGYNYNSDMWSQVLMARSGGSFYGDISVNANPVLHSGNFNTYAPTLTGTGASGTWNIGISGNAATATSATSLSNNTIYMANRGSVAAASIDTAILNGFYTQTNAGDTSAVLVFNSAGSVGPVQQRFNYLGSFEFRNQTDSTNWNAWKTLLHNANFNSYAPTLTGTGATGTWPISISGSAASATTASQIDSIEFRNGNFGNPVGPDTVNDNGIGYITGVSLFGQNDGALYSQAYSSSWVHQIYGDYRTGQLAVRGRNSGTLTPWRFVLDSSNYSSYALPLSGGTITGDLTLNSTVTAGGGVGTTGQVLTSTGTGVTWGTISASGGGATGGSTDKVFYENDTIITTSYTIGASKNAMTAGPITINSGVSVTIPSGSVWTVV